LSKPKGNSVEEWRIETENSYNYTLSSSSPSLTFNPTSFKSSEYTLYPRKRRFVGGEAKRLDMSIRMWVKLKGKIFFT